MAQIKIPFPTNIAADCLRRGLIQAGLSSVVAQCWRISVENSEFHRELRASARWRNYAFNVAVSYSDLEEPLQKLEKLLLLLYGELQRYNAAEDEEHMEALVLLSMRPTNAPHNQQL